MPSIEDLNKKRAEIERKKREIADLFLFRSSMLGIWNPSPS